MPTRRTLLLGPPGEYNSCRHDTLLSNTNLSEFSTIIIDNGAAFSAIKSFLPYLFNNIINRLKDIDTWIDRGHTLIIVLTHHGIDYQGTYYGLEQLPIFNHINYDYISGTQIEYCGPQLMEEIFSDFITGLRYELIISATQLIPLLQVKRASRGPRQFVGGILKKDKGRIIIVPYPADQDSYRSYIEELAELADWVQEPPEAIPDWAKTFQTSDEVKMVDNIHALRARISEIETAIQTEEEKISQTEHFKTLFFGSGDAFATAVSDALTELGLRVVVGPHPRADLIAFDDAHGLLVIEAKGLDGSAREKNLTQVQRWKDEVKDTFASSEEELQSDSDLRRYADKLVELGISLPPSQDINVKGLMVIGTFRKTPLDKRVDSADFPHPVIQIASRSAVCAITGLQLLLMILQARKDPTSKAKFVDQLFATTGQVELDITWKDFLTLR